MGEKCRGRPCLWVLVAFVAWMGSTCAEIVSTYPDEPVNTDFDNWLSYIAETSDQDDVPASTSNAPALSAGSSSAVLSGHLPGSISSKDEDHEDHDDKKHKKSKKGKGTKGKGTKGKGTKGSGTTSPLTGLPKPKGTPKKITVSKHGKGDFRTINAALDSIPEHSKFRHIIHIKAGTYVEKIFINTSKPYITFRGDGMFNTIISWNDTAGDFDDQDVLLKTYKSATVGVNSEFFVAENIQFRNTAPSPPPGAVLRQAVALRITADRAAFYNSSFFGFQDTLYDHRGRHYFENCFVQGSIDFIFGNGRSLYRGCKLHAVADTFGSLTAQKKNESRMDTGFSFVDCSVFGTGIIYLGRAWGNFSRTVYSYTWMDNIIYPPGWSDFGFPDRDQKVFYAQYHCTGPGASTVQRVPFARQLTAVQAKPFLSVNFINGKSWLTHYIKTPKFT